jgi:NAD(P)-dependent dehydrogenase (short-subunit alcohol dehydrogenase family)
MDYQLKNKTTLVTGSTSGIGFSIAKLLSNEGARIVLNGRTEESVSKAVAKLKKENPAALVSGVAADFHDKDSVQELIAKVKDVDILVNNVGIFTSQSFSDTSDEDWYSLFEVNVMSGVRLSRMFLPKMLDRGWGRIIFISSECAQLVPEDLIAYSMTKAALLNISRGLAQITKGTAVTVNTVMPGSTLSEGAKRFLNDQATKEKRTMEEVETDFFKNVRTSSLLGRFTSTEEIAQAVVYLASPLSSATNGAVFKVDGGSVPGII